MRLDKSLDDSATSRRKIVSRHFYWGSDHVSAVHALAKPRRIKASHRRRWKRSTGHSVYANNNPYTFVDPDGSWACEGSNPDCGKFEVALGRAADAAGSARLASGEQAALQRVVDFYGRKGDHRVRVAFADLPGTGGTAAMRSDGGELITLDLAQAERRLEERGINVLARVIAHEGEHGANDQQRGRPAGTLRSL